MYSDNLCVRVRMMCTSGRVMYGSFLVHSCFHGACIFSAFSTVACVTLFSYVAAPILLQKPESQQWTNGLNEHLKKGTRLTTERPILDKPKQELRSRSLQMRLLF